jgi:hypothetical protein
MEWCVLVRFLGQLLKGFCALLLVSCKRKPTTHAASQNSPCIMRANTAVKNGVPDPTAWLKLTAMNRRLMLPSTIVKQKMVASRQTFQSWRRERSGRIGKLPVRESAKAREQQAIMWQRVRKTGCLRLGCGWGFGAGRGIGVGWGDAGLARSGRRSAANVAPTDWLLSRPLT